MIPLAALALIPMLAPSDVDDEKKQAGATLEERVERLEGENHELRGAVGVLTEELERFELGELFPPMGEGRHGFGPAASKIYNRQDQGLSIGGYGEALYRSYSGSSKASEFDFLRAVLYFGYKFDERWLFNSEIEFEHASTSTGGSASVEFAYLDYLFCERMGFRSGLLLSPMGFLNELHEPQTFLATTRPVTEQRIIPSTWRENGAGVFGDAGPVSYRAYVMNGLDAAGFDADGLRGGRQKGGQALAEDLAVAVRADWVDTPGVTVGGSIYMGDSGQGQTGFGDTGTSIYELHGEVKASGFWLRGLAAMAEVDDVVALNAANGLAGAASAGEELEGYYLELGYDVMSRIAPESEVSVIPFVRWETVDTQAAVPAGFSRDPANDFDVVTVGIHFQPVDQVVFKLDVQDVDPGVDSLNLSMGYAF